MRTVGVCETEQVELWNEGGRQQLIRFNSWGISEGKEEEDEDILNRRNTYYLYILYVWLMMADDT